MPLDKLMLILVLVILSAGFTILVAAVIQTSLAYPVGWAIAIPIALVAYVVARVVLQRLGNRDDDHYDRIDR